MSRPVVIPKNQIFRGLTWRKDRWILALAVLKQQLLFVLFYKNRGQPRIKAAPVLASFREAIVDV